MTNLASEKTIAPASSPLDMFEEIFADEDWPSERIGDEEISAGVSGAWSEYHLRLMWRPEEGMLYLLCAFDLKVPAARRAAIHETLSLVNERMWMGHFEMWADDGTVLYRHTAFLGQDADGIAGDHAELLVKSAIGECERFYPVFQFVIWAGKKPHEALEAAMLETAGEA